MHTEEVWTLDDADQPLIERLAAGLGNAPARVLAYLILRSERSEIDDGPATQLDIRVGTGMNRKVVNDALSDLEAQEFIAQTSVQRNPRGRPLKAWHVTEGGESICSRVYNHHAATLLRRISTVFEIDPSGEEFELRDDDVQQLTLAVNWQPNGLHMPFYAAAGDSRYADHGVAVRFEHHEGSRRALSAVASGDADIGVVGAATIIRAREAGISVVPLAVLYQRAMTVLYTTRETFGEPFETVEQLRGRRIGVPVQSETGVLARLFLSQANLAESVHFVDTVGEEQHLLLTDDADVVTGSFSDPQRLQERGMTVDSILVADHFPIYGPSLVVHEDALADRSKLFRNFLMGTMDGWAQTKLHPTKATQRVPTKGDVPSDNMRDMFEWAVDQFGENDTVRKHGWGWQRTEMWDRLRTALSHADLLGRTL